MQADRLQIAYQIKVDILIQEIRFQAPVPKVAFEMALDTHMPVQSTTCEQANIHQNPQETGDSPGKNTLLGFYDLLQGIFLTQGSNATWQL